MKKLLFSLCTLALLASCKNDDGGGTQDTRDYLPTTVNTSWNYDYTVSNQGDINSGTTSVDYETTTINGESYQMLDNTMFLIGAMNQIPFRKNATNEIVIRPIVDFLGNEWDFGNMNFIQSSMSSNQLLATSSQEFVGETVDIPDENISGTVTPHTFVTINSYHVGKSNTMMVNETNYENILQNNLSFEIKVVLDINATYQGVEFDREHELVPQQIYGNLDLWLAENTGIIKSDYNYSFQNLDMNTEINVIGNLNLDLLDLAPELANFNSSLNLQGNANLITIQ